MMPSLADQKFHREVKAVQRDLEKSNKISKEDSFSNKLNTPFRTLKVHFHFKSQTTSTSRIFLLEIYASENCPFTDAVRDLGYKAMRFTKKDGDLSTFSGRMKLWNWIEEYQPEHIWMAPEWPVGRLEPS